MMCNPCFMDANQVGYVHELSFEDIKKILDRSLSFQPRRVAQVQFSGGEPTISPYFLDACRYAREIGYTGIQAASNAVRFALEPDFAFKAKEAGLNLVYFQLDGVTNEANQHRHISNLFDIKRQALENLYQAGIWVTPVTTIVNGLNTEQIGPLMQFLIDNCDKMDAISFQPVSFTGRDEEITDEQRHSQRFTTSHLAYELEKWSEGEIDIHRDWYPLGAGVPLTNLADHLASTADHWGGMCVSCHPDCGSCIYIVANKKTKKWSTLTKFFDLDKFIKDVDLITDTSRGKKLTQLQLALSLARNFDEEKGTRRIRFFGTHHPHPAPVPRIAYRRRASPAERLDTHLGRRYVVPGSVDVRLPPHRDVLRSVRHAGRRNILLCIQHRYGMAADNRTQTYERHHQRLVQNKRQAPDLRR